MNAVGYISSYKQNSEERIIENRVQEEKILEYCKNYGYKLVQIYEEPEESRQDYKPALVNLINDARSGKFQKVIIYKYDIIGNDEGFKSWVISELKKQKIEIFSLTEANIDRHIVIETPTDVKIETLKKKVRDIPSLPEIVVKVMELVQDPMSSAAQLGKVILHDPGLTTRVLKLVNSAYYGFPKQISSIQHAIMILGFTTMRGLVLSSSIFKIFSQKTDNTISLDYKKFWKHSLITALAAKNINKYLFYSEDEDLFSAAILHDIGKIILDQYDHDNYATVLSEIEDPTNAENVLYKEMEHCELSHAEIGFVVAENWNLPENLADVIRYHHNPFESMNNTKLSSIVYIANILSHIILDDKLLLIDKFDLKVLEHLGLSEDDLIEISTLTRVEVDKAGDFESFFK